MDTLTSTTGPPTKDTARWIAQVASLDRQKADEMIRSGLPFDYVSGLQELLNLTDDEAALLIGRSRRTYSRYRNDNRDLGAPEAERVVRLARLVALAAEVFGSIEEARSWMREPNLALRGRAPIKLAETAPGASIVRELLEGSQRGYPL